jgi:hypothetical protein
MQGRVREGGDHLAALGFECNPYTSAKERLAAPKTQSARVQGISFFHLQSGPFPVAADGFPSLLRRKSALLLDFRSFAIAPVPICNGGLDSGPGPPRGIAPLEKSLDILEVRR